MRHPKALVLHVRGWNVRFHPAPALVGSGLGEHACAPGLRNGNAPPTPPSCPSAGGSSPSAGVVSDVGVRSLLGALIRLDDGTPEREQPSAQPQLGPLIHSVVAPHPRGPLPELKALGQRAGSFPGYNDSADTTATTPVSASSPASPLFSPGSAHSGGVRLPALSASQSQPRLQAQAAAMLQLSQAAASAASEAHPSPPSEDVLDNSRAEGGGWCSPNLSVADGGHRSRWLRERGSAGRPSTLAESGPVEPLRAAQPESSPEHMRGAGPRRISMSGLPPSRPPSSAAKTLPKRRSSDWDVRALPALLSASSLDEAREASSRSSAT